MDNNLVSIDDLVRQRLGGAEEREPSGAWLRMRELLDEKEDRKPVGFIWRRMFGGIAILALLASLSLGGYKLSSHYRSIGSGNGTEIAMNTPTGNSSSDHTITNKDNNNLPGNNLNNPDHKQNTVIAGKNENKPANNNIKNTHSNTSVNNIATNTNTNKNKENNSGTNSHINSNPVLAATTNDATLPSKVAKKAKTSPSTNTEIANHPTSSNNTNQKNQNNNDANSTSDNEVNNNTTKTEQLTASTNTDQPINNSLINKTQEHKSTPAAKSDISKSGNSTASTAGAKKQNGLANGTAKHNQNSLAVKEVKHPAKGSDKVVSENENSTSGTNDEVAISKMPIGSSHPSGADTRKKLPVNNPIANSVNKTNDADKKLATSGSSAHGKGTKSTPDKKDNNLDAKKLPVASSGHGVAKVPGENVADNTDLKNNDSISTRMVKKLIQKITIRPRLTQTGPNTYVTHMDTISNETINQEFAVNDNTRVYGPPTVRQYMERNSNNANDGNKLIIPGASTEWTDDVAAEKVAEKLAKNEKSKSKGGTGLAQSLESAINDIKYSISGTRFSAGLKGGINGTFFGPNNFKGFQMGVTGNFIFSESVNILAELQYFQRVNSGYIMNDDYYTYTQIGPNMWSRQQIQNPFSFSTLHSFELPLIVRYTKKNFNFFIGANMIYTMAVNESQGIATPGASTQVAAVGNDTQPNIKESDFNGRFGLGYLFGASVQLSPVMSLDIRDVQTLWDNAGTTGSKEVSSQLFRSPSFQLSLGYRFGGKKAKQKE